MLNKRLVSIISASIISLSMVGCQSNDLSSTSLEEDFSKRDALVNSLEPINGNLPEDVDVDFKGEGHEQEFFNQLANSQNAHKNFNYHPQEYGTKMDSGEECKAYIVYCPYCGKYAMDGYVREADSSFIGMCLECNESICLESDYVLNNDNSYVTPQDVQNTIEDVSGFDYGDESYSKNVLPCFRCGKESERAYNEGFCEDCKAYGQCYDCGEYKLINTMTFNGRSYHCGCNGGDIMNNAEVNNVEGDEGFVTDGFTTCPNCGEAESFDSNLNMCCMCGYKEN